MSFVPGDSVLVSKGYRMDVISGLIEKTEYCVLFPLADSCTYNVHIEASGYLPRIVPITVSKNHKSMQAVRLGEVGLLREPKQLDEVTVTATRIKMYYDGDTLVYNADYFLLPDGSMLDDLIRKLDGVTIDRHGQIFCRGRKVENLMLEGKKLFEGSPDLLLRNLGAYTVKNIKVYDYTSPEEKFKGYGSGAEKPMVMDVVLKKEYSIGKWVNLDAGYGTSNRYLGRLFALGFTKTTALSAFVNVNNLSTGDDPTKHDQWSPGKASGSDSRYISGGLSYQYDAGKRSFRGTAAVNTSDILGISGSESVTYLEGGDRYKTSYSRSHGRNLKVSTNHNLYWQFRKATLCLTPAFTYTRNHTDGTGTSATFDEDMGKVTADEIDAIYSGDSDRLLRHAINRNLTRRENTGTRYYGNIGVSNVVRLPDRGAVRHNLTFNAGGNYGNSFGDFFNRYTINYGQDATPASDVYAYRNTRPSWSVNANGSARYEMNVDNRHTVSLTYAYTHHRDRNTSDRYLLSNLDRVSMEGLRFAELPPDLDLTAVIDPDNSHHTRYITNSHRINGRLNLVWERERGEYRDRMTFFANPSIEMLGRSYDYARPNYDTTVVRRTALPSVNAGIDLSKKQQEGRRMLYSVDARWESKPSLVSMDNLINTSNTSDPLYITRGNPNLRNGYSHHASLRFMIQKCEPTLDTHTLSFSYSFGTNQIVRGYIYDPQTGVTESTLYNLNGMRSYSADYNGSGRVFKHGRTRMDYNLSASALDARNPVMVGEQTESGRIEPARRFLYNRDLRPSAGLSLHYGKLSHSVSFNWNGNFSRFSSTAEDYQPMSTTYMRCSLGVGFGLPKNIRLSTNATLYTRSGYDDPQLNTSECVWNVSASWHWKKPGLTFIFDGYDILGQIKRVSAMADALGRTESWSNTLPRYFLLRVRYHLDLSPR